MLYYVIYRDSFDEIEYHTNTSDPQTHLESISKPREADFFDNALQRLDFFKLLNCKFSATYISQVQGIISKLRSFSSKYKLDKNF